MYREPKCNAQCPCLSILSWWPGHNNPLSQITESIVNHCHIFLKEDTD